MECEYLKVQKLHHNDGNETTTYKCYNPRSNRFEKRSFYSGFVCDTCIVQEERNGNNL